MIADENERRFAYVIKRLWVYPLLCLVTFGLSWILQGYGGSFFHSHYHRELKMLTNVGVEIEELGPIHADALKLLPQGESKMVDLSKDVLDILPLRIREREGWQDGWGNSYCVVVKERNGERWIGFFSCGMDGLSLTQGNDDDDINSWNRESGKYYGEWSRQKMHERHMKGVWKTFSVVLVALLVYYELTVEIEESAGRGRCDVLESLWKFRRGLAALEGVDESSSFHCGWQGAKAGAFVYSLRESKKLGNLGCQPRSRSFVFWTDLWVQARLRERFLSPVGGRGLSKCLARPW